MTEYRILPKLIKYHKWTDKDVAEIWLHRKEENSTLKRLIAEMTDAILKPYTKMRERNEEVSEISKNVLSMACGMTVSIVLSEFQRFYEEHKELIEDE